MKISSPYHSEYQEIQALKSNRKKRTKSKEFYAEGTELIKKAIEAKVPISRFIYRDYEKLSDWAKSVLPAAEKSIELSSDLYKNLVEREEVPELIMTAGHPENHIDDFTFKENSFVIVFDRPSDGGNLGSLIRSADGMNVDAIFILGHGVDYLSEKCLKASVGSALTLPVYNLQSNAQLFALVDAWKEAFPEMKFFGSDSDGEYSLGEGKVKRPLALCLGNERTGMSIAVKEQVDAILSIPLSGVVGSLNVSCAASVMIWQINQNS
jgi:tRNA G18 (ribose-2'-O)-methylase SpoU